MFLVPVTSCRIEYCINGRQTSQEARAQAYICSSAEHRIARAFRDPQTGKPRHHRFGIVSREEAEAAYHEWVAGHLRGETYAIKRLREPRKLDDQLTSPKPRADGESAEVVPGSRLHIASGFLSYEESRVSDDEVGTRRRGTITRKRYKTRKQFVQEFLRLLNSRSGQGAVGQMTLADLTMLDVEVRRRGRDSSHALTSEARA